MARDNTVAYDDPMSQRLLGIAADVLRSFGSGFGGQHIAIIGGAVPSLLVRDPPRGMTPHVGTADLDLHLSLHLIDGETSDYYDSIIDGLRSMNLEPDRANGRAVKWRWVGRHRGTSVQVELLCPVRTKSGRPEAPAKSSPAEANVGPNGQITALALGYGHLVPDDTIWVKRRIESAHGSLTYEFPVAGLTSWLCLKSDAIMRRAKPKDAYDVVWTLDALGPDAAATSVSESQLLHGPFATEVLDQLSCLVSDQFRDVASTGPRQYRKFLVDDQSRSAQRHAMGTIQEFGARLVDLGLL